MIEKARSLGVDIPELLPSEQPWEKPYHLLRSPFLGVARMVAPAGESRYQKALWTACGVGNSMDLTTAFAVFSHRP